MIWVNWYSQNQFHFTDEYFEKTASPWDNKKFSHKLFSDDFLLHAQLPPRKEQLQLLFLAEKDAHGYSEVADQGLTKIYNVSKDLYRVQLTVSEPKSGTFVPVFNNGFQIIRGPLVRLQVASEAGDFQKLLSIFMGTAIFIVFAPIILFILIWRMKLLLVIPGEWQNDVSYWWNAVS